MASIRDRISGALGVATTEQRIEAERQAISAADREIADLRSKQAGNLLDQDPRTAFDGAEALAAAQRKRGIHSDRLEALQALRRQETVDRRGEQKAAALAALKKRLDTGIVPVAARIDAALQELSDSVTAYDVLRKEAFTGWPSNLFPRQDFMTVFDAVDVVASHLNIHRSALFRLPRLLMHLQSGDTFTLAERAKSNADWLVRGFEEMPLPALPEVDEEEAA